MCSMAAGSSLWPTAVARGRSGADQHRCWAAMFKTAPYSMAIRAACARIGADVTVGHRAVIHGATLEDGCLVGIGAIVLNGVTVGAGCPGCCWFCCHQGCACPGTLVMGAPAACLRGSCPLMRLMKQRCHAQALRAAGGIPRPLSGR